MVSRAVLILGHLWIHILVQASGGEELPRGVVLSWFREQVLEGLGLEEPPPNAVQGHDRDSARPEMRRIHARVPRTSRAVRVNHQTRSDQDTSQIILFSSSESSCAVANSAPRETADTCLAYYFQPSINFRDTAVTSAHFWFYAGKGATANSSAPLFLLNSAQKLLQAAEDPSELSSDGWTTYHLDRSLLASVAKGPFLLQVHCAACQCRTSEPDKTPFVHLHVRPRGPVRSRRQAEVTIPWSPSAIYLLQRPSQEKPRPSDCRRAEFEVTFEDLGWDNWIVHPKALTFYYCQGDCSSVDRSAAKLGISQCCAPVPGTMKSLKVTTTSDGGYSFKHETLPNIMPAECTCI
ncbi:inhibin alpha chain [Odontesthes bonariensis]|uniref:inhibin alpha chain n=1 Tax=Odontesthes bonariensis TaxID=219752 RepID=UPI003F5832C4